jgi:hypothetical protein
MSVVLRVDDGPLRDWLNSADSRGEEVKRLFSDEGSILTLQEMRATVPVRRGFLRESITRQVYSDGFSVFPTAKYAPYVDQGTGPHTIFPVVSRVLRFTMPSGAVIFAKHVHHPGSQGRFFIQKTVENVRGKLAELLHNILERIYSD